MDPKCFFLASFLLEDTERLFRRLGVHDRWTFHWLGRTDPLPLLAMLLLFVKDLHVFQSQVIVFIRRLNPLN